MPQLKFYGSFRVQAGVREMSVAAATVYEALEQAWADRPKLREAMLDAGTLRAYVRVLVNGRHIELAHGLDTPLKPEDEVAIFSPMAGGLYSL